jgi:hypothetical protein
VGARLHLSGRVRGDLFGHELVRIEAFTRGKWRFMLAGKVGAGGRFALRTRLKRSVRHEFPVRRRAEVLLRHFHLSAGRRLSLRAAVRGIDPSNVARVRLGR